MLIPWRGISLLCGAGLLVGSAWTQWGRSPREFSRSEAPQSLLTIGVASSLTEAFQALQREFETQYPPHKLRLHIAASGVLQQQIAQGAPMDVLATASVDWLAALHQPHRFPPDHCRILAENRLVLITGPQGDRSPLASVEQLSDLQRLPLKRLAIGNPKTVPAGDYAREALRKAGVYGSLIRQEKLIFGENVRQVLSYVARGYVDGALVYGTDVAVSPEVRVVLSVPPEFTSPIRYGLTPVQNSAVDPTTTAIAQDFFTFMESDRAQEILREAGFLVPPPTACFSP